MKTLITFYSFEGNCRALSSIMADAVLGDMEELLPVRDPVPHGTVGKYLAGGRVSLFKQTTELQPLRHNPDDYDLVVVGGPVWFFNITPALRTFLGSRDWGGRPLALFSMHRGGRGKAIASMRRLVEERHGRVVGTAEFVDLRRGAPDETRRRAVDWITGLMSAV